MTNFRDDAPPIPLSKGPFGIERFRLEGCVDAEPVHAQWDGRWVRASRTLCEHAELAIAVEEAFDEASVSSRPHLTNRSSPEGLMLALVTCCDQIDLVEYQVNGHRRVICA
jgi:hypothetical protein